MAGHKKEELSPEEKLKHTVSASAKKKIKARQEGSKMMFGFGLFGVVGWSVAVPTLLGVFLGLYLDENAPMYFSWTLTLLFAGIIIGALNAWHWVKKNSEDDKEEV